MALPNAQSLVIKTPEGIVFPLLLASPVTRFLALLVDLMAIHVVSIIIGIVSQLVYPIGGEDMAGALYGLASFVVTIGYSMFLEWFWRGQTIGKRMLGLRVMDENGLHLTGQQIIIRNLLRFIDMLPAIYMVGGIACLASSKSQRLGDMVANTVVIRTPQITEPDLEQIMGGKFNSLREYPHIAARLRQRTSQELAGIALSALLRRDSLNPGDRLELFQAIARRLHDVVSFPQEATEGQSDEQFIRNAVDILFRA